MNNEGIFVGVFQAMQHNSYTGGIFQYIIVILIFALSLYIFRDRGINYLRSINASLIVTFILSVLLMIIGVVSDATVIIESLLIVCGMVYQRLTEN